MNHNIYYFASWEDFAGYFWSLPLPFQILVVIGIITILALLIVGIYYLIKGICYLIYYILKGLYLLIKAVIIGIYKSCEWLYYKISGKEKPEKTIIQQKQTPNIQIQKANINIIRPENFNEKQKEIKTELEKYPESINQNLKTIAYCPHCGIKFPDRIKSTINSRGFAFCPFCGNGIEKSKVYEY
ncbi:MAG: hypothetical protein ACTSVV_08310 [Promethearchaeota archaeon]